MQTSKRSKKGLLNFSATSPSSLVSSWFPPFPVDSLSHLLRGISQGLSILFRELKLTQDSPSLWPFAILQPSLELVTRVKKSRLPDNHMTILSQHHSTTTTIQFINHEERNLRYYWIWIWISNIHIQSAQKLNMHINWTHFFHFAYTTSLTEVHIKT